MTTGPKWNPVCSPLELEAVHAVCRAAGIGHGVGFEGLGDDAAIALFDAASDAPGGLGDLGTWVDELIAALGRHVADRLGEGWERVAVSAVISAALDVEACFDRMALAVMFGKSPTVCGPDAADAVAENLTADAVWSC